MQPRAVDDNVIRCAFCRNQLCRRRRACGASDLQSNKAVIVSSRSNSEWTCSSRLHLHFRHHVFWTGAVIFRTSWKRSDAGVTRRSALAFRGQKAVRRTGADDDPMATIAILSGNRELSGKSSSRLQLNHVAAERIVQSCLQIASGINRNNACMSWRVRHGTCNCDARQFCGTIKAGRCPSWKGGKQGEADHDHRD